MATATFTVTDPVAPKRAARPGIRRVAEEIAADAAQRTPEHLGRLRRGWVTQAAGDFDYQARNDVGHALAVEYGSGVYGRRGRPRPQGGWNRPAAMLGQAIALAERRW